MSNGYCFDPACDCNKITEEPIRYRIVSDDDHEYVIPVDNYDAWKAWRDSDAAMDGDMSAVEEWTIRIDGTFTFTDPRVE